MKILPIVLIGITRASTTCDTADLELPKNGKGWICDGGNNAQVPSSRKCVLECEEEYTAETVFKRDFHRCKNGEWFQPSRVLLRCTRDLDDAIKSLEAKLDSKFVETSSGLLDVESKIDELKLSIENFEGQCAAPTIMTTTTATSSSTTTATTTSTTNTSTTSTSEPNPGDYGFPKNYKYAKTSFGKEIFYASYDIYNRKRGKALCEDDGARLPIPKSAEENQFYSEFFGGPMWLGISDEIEDGVWLDDYGSLVDWFNWEEIMEPSKPQGDEHAVDMWPSPFFGEWTSLSGDSWRMVNCVFVIPTVSDQTPMESDQS